MMSDLAELVRGPLGPYLIGGFISLLAVVGKGIFDWYIATKTKKADAQIKQAEIDGNERTQFWQELRAELAEARAETRAYRAEVAGLHKEIAAARAEIARLTGIVEALTQSESHWKTEAARLDAELKALRDKFEDKEEENMLQFEELTRLRERNAVLEKLFDGRISADGGSSGPLALEKP